MAIKRDMDNIHVFARKLVKCRFMLHETFCLAKWPPPCIKCIKTIDFETNSAATTKLSLWYCYFELKAQNDKYIFSIIWRSKRWAIKFWQGSWYKRSISREEQIAKQKTDPHPTPPPQPPSGRRFQKFY